MGNGEFFLIPARSSHNPGRVQRFSGGGYGRLKRKSARCPDPVPSVNVMVSSNSSLSAPTPLSLPLGKRLTDAQLVSINTHLDQLLLALYALTELEEVTWRRALHQVALGEFAPAMAAMGRLEHPQGLRAPSVSQLDLDGIRAMVAVISHLTQQYQELLRRSVTLVEQTTEQGKDPFQTILLGGYGEKLRELDQVYRAKQPQSVPALTGDRALSLLMELLFYSSDNGARRLWGVLLITAQTLVYEASSG